MAIGRKTGGRAAGTPNKRTADLAERLEAAHFDPVQVVIDVARDEASSPELRLRAASELLPYCFAKRKALEHSGTGGDPVQSFHEIRFVSPSARDAKELTG